MLGLLVPDIANPFFPPFVRALEARAYQRGYAVLLMDTDEHTERERVLLLDLAGRTDGVILCSPRSRADQIRDAASHRPVVLVNRTVPGLASVTCSTRDGLGQLVEHLYAHGHRRIAYLSGPISSWSNRERRDSVRRRANSLGMHLDVIGPYPPTFDGGTLAGDAVILNGATAAIAFDDVMALGVHHRLSDRGYTVPGDISISGCDDILFAAMTLPALTTVAAPIAEAGRVAADLVLDQLESSDASRVQRVTLSGTFIARGSTGPVSQQPSRLRARS
jgi:LacI family transcriptional regulator